LGFHSHRHENYGRLSLAGVTADVERGMTVWRDELGAVPTAFAFPKGGYGACPASAVSVLRRSGFALLFSTRLGRTRLPSEAPVLDRIVIHHEDDLGVFRRKLFGAYDWLGGLRTAAQAGRAVVGR
jgi:peptidoglycan/xylan/chitin deacetylase (PgdA/CDA1 family)